MNFVQKLYQIIFIHFVQMQNPNYSQGVRFNPVVNAPTNTSQPIYIQNQLKQTSPAPIIGKPNQVSFNNFNNRTTFPQKVQGIPNTYQTSFDSRGIPVNNQYPVQTYPVQNVNSFQEASWTKNDKMGATAERKPDEQNVNVVKNNQMVERPYFQKSYNNNGDRRQLGPQADPAFKNTFCTPLLAGIIGLIALLGLLLCIILAFTTGHQGPILNKPSSIAKTSDIRPVDVNSVDLEAFPISGQEVIVKKSVSIVAPQGKKTQTKTEVQSKNVKPLQVPAPIPIQAKLIQTKPGQTKPVQTKPIQTIPSETKPSETKISEVQPIVTPYVDSDFQYPPDPNTFGQNAGKSSLEGHKRLHKLISA